MGKVKFVLFVVVVVRPYPKELVQISFLNRQIFSNKHSKLQGIQMTTRRKLCAIKGISEAKVDKIKVR